MNTKEFLADDRFLTAECRQVRHDISSMPELAQGMASQYFMRRTVRCADGFAVSIQYSPLHYCNAREPVRGGEWAGRGHPLPEPTSVELGFPTRREPLLKEYAEEPKRMTKTVYGWVPIAVVDEVLAKHGGITQVLSDETWKWENVV